MGISAVVSGTEISSLLRGSGLAAHRVAIVEDEIQDLEQQVTTIASRTLDNDAFRTALAARIDSDVAAGTLSQSDGTRIKRALGLTGEQDTAEAEDAVPAQAGIVTTARQGANGTRAAGSGNASAAKGKSEVSRSETIANGVKTTLVLFDDGTSETQVSYTTAPDTPVIPFVASAYGFEDASSYLLTIAHGTFLDLRA